MSRELTSAWPDLGLESGPETGRTLHMWTQMVGKVRLALEPMMNHWWQVPLYVTAQGLTTTPMRSGERFFEILINLREHALELRATDGAEERLPLPLESTLAEFHERFCDALERLGVDVEISPIAVEIPETIHLDRDKEPRRYDPEWASRLFTALVRADRLFKDFRAPFTGKSSPVHFFWGSFDLAVTRFSGRRAPLHPGGVPHCRDYVMHEAYASEVSSAGFWPGSPSSPRAIFYSYAFPQPDGFSRVKVLPPEAGWDLDLGEFVLPYDAVRTGASPEAMVHAFLQSTYDGAAELAHWDRAQVERPLDPTSFQENAQTLRAQRGEAAAEHSAPP